MKTVISLKSIYDQNVNVYYDKMGITIHVIKGKNIETMVRLNRQYVDLLIEFLKSQIEI